MKRPDYIERSSAAPVFVFPIFYFLQEELRFCRILISIKEGVKVVGLICKPRKVPRINQQFEALLRRLPMDHMKREQIAADFAKRQAGFAGEQSLDYPLSFLEEDFYIFHDLRLFDGSHYFQIDTLILCKGFILILEVKNIQGTLFFDTDFNQLIRTKSDMTEAFPDPLLQVERQHSQLFKWLNNYKLSKIPIETLIVISSPRTILQTAPNNHPLYEKVIHSAKLPSIISSFREKHPPILKSIQLNRLADNIIQNHHPLETDILAQYFIEREEIIKGVFCYGCSHVPISRRNGIWYCPQCGKASRDAHLQALADYFLLFGNSITNHSARDFLCVGSSSTVNKILRTLNFSSKGTNRWRVYHFKAEN